MAEQDLNVGINATSNIPTVVQKVVRSLESLENNFEDLKGVLQDLAKFSAQASGSIENVAKSAQTASKNVADSVSSIDKFRAALQKTGREGDVALKNLDFSEINLKSLSVSEIEQFSKKLREAGTNLGDFISTGKIDLNFRPAIEDLNKLQSLLGRGLSAPEDFGNTKEVFAELRNLNQQLRTEIETTLENIKVPDTAFTSVGELRSEILKLTTESRGGGELNLLGDLQENRAEALRTVDAIDEIRLKLIEIGPAAQSGNQKAIKEFLELSNQLDSANRKAVTLSEALRGGRKQFATATDSQNQTLAGFGFREITLEDIFPSAEQKRVDDLRSRIDGAVRQSVQAGAVRDTLNTFLRSSFQLTGDLDRNVVSLVSHLPRLRYALYDVSNSVTVFSVGLAGASFAALKMSADFERSFADVARTTGLFGAEAVDEARALKDELIGLTQQLPLAFSEVSEIATLAGQLNIASDSIADFTENVAKFAATTDVTVEAAATAFGRLDQLVDGVDGQFEKLGSSILAVGVNAVATESDIIAIATQIASVANIAGFSASELIGFSSALASVGTRPELARGTFTRLFTEIQQSVAEGGEQLRVFAQVAGQSQEQFVSTWGEGSGADQVIAVLRGLNEAGTEADQVLAQLGITSVRDVPTLLKLAQSVEEVERQIQIANIGFIEGTALQDQYSVITSTLTEKLVVLKNNFSALLNTLGSATGFFSILVDGLILITRALEEILDNPINQFIVGLVTVIVGALGAIGLMGAALLRAGGSLVGFATASIESREAVGLMKVSVDQLNGSLVTNTGVMNTNTTSKKAATATSKAFVGVVGAEVTGTNAATAATRNFNGALVGGFKATRIFTAGLVGLGITVASIALFTIIDEIYELGKAAGHWGNQADKATTAAEKFNEQFGESSSFLQAVQDDTENYRNANDELRESFETFTGSVQDSNVQISDRGAILAVVTGQEDLLAGAASKTADEIERQTLAIGDNTEKLIAQTIAQRLANDALEDNIGVARVEQAIRLKGVLDAPVGAFGFDAISEARRQLGEQGAQIGIASVFEVVTDPELSARLKAAGFDFQEYITAVRSGNEELARSVIEDLEPAAQALSEALQAEDPEKFADAIIFLNGAAEFGAEGLGGYLSAGSELREAIKALVFEQEILNGVLGDTGALENFRDALKGTFEELFAPINAQREMEDSVRALGAAFAEESPEIVVNSSAMQAAIASIINTASNNDEAIDGLAGLYNAIVDGGYASREQLELVGQQIIETYRIAAQAQIQLLRQSRDALALDPTYQNRQRGGGAIARQIGDYNTQIRAQEEIIRNISVIDITTGNSAQSANLLAQGYTNVRNSASGAKEEVKEIEEETEQAVRTLLDYAGDLESVFSRAFDIRFSRGSALDDIAESFDALSKSVEDARFELEELQASQGDLSADRGIKEYFLSIAEAYNDTLRAAQLREEIAELDRDQAQNARELEAAQQIAGGDLTSQGPGSRQNRQALLGLVGNYQSYITALAESGASQAELTAATAQARQEFEQQARELGFQEQDIQTYAAAFDDVQTAIASVERNITVEANVNPALQALNELNASLNKQIQAANDLNRALNQPVVQTSSAEAAKQIRASLIQAEINRLEGLIRNNPGSIFNNRNQALANQLRRKLASGNYSQGGYTGRGGMMEPAGIVHRGEYVVPKQYVNQSTGMPDPSFLAQMQSGMRNYFMGGFVGGGGGGTDGGTMMVELSPFDRKLLADAGNVQLRLNGRIVAEATNQNNFNQARRGSD